LKKKKKIREQADNADGLRDKLLLMEDKLAKMEKRKSVSISLHMQQQMANMEAEMKKLRSAGGVGSDQKVAVLEKTNFGNAKC